MIDVVHENQHDTIALELGTTAPLLRMQRCSDKHEE